MHNRIMKTCYFSVLLKMSLPVKNVKLFRSMKTSCLTQPGHVVLFPCQAAAGQRAIAVLSDDVFLFSYFTRRHVSADMQAMFDDVRLRLRVQYLIFGMPNS